MSDKVQDEQIQSAVIDHLEQVIQRSKEQLEKVVCPVHGQALKRLDFDRTRGRFDIDTCCEEGEKLVNEAIQKLG